MGRKKRQSLVTESFSFKKERVRLQKRAQDNQASTSSSGTSSATQQDSELDKLLQFDFNWKYGPCLNITRLQRWERALELGLSPPEDVRKIILSNVNDKKYTECVWNKYKIFQT